ncbi:MAG TPA: aminofutalosine synthase MqnE [Armatimonadota bacterium]|jgi:aminodeoxyfutalosine synthase
MHELILQSDLKDIYSRVLAGQRLTLDDGVRLYESPHLAYVGHMANLVRERMNGDKAYYVRNQHINYTNICQKDCKFCSFYAKKGGPDPYVLSPDDIADRVRRYIDLPVTEIHVVGGIHPRLPYSYYLDLLSAIRQVRPDVHIKAWTMVELAQIHKVGPFETLEETLTDLQRHGLASCPGGGAEVSSERVHQELFGKKLDSAEWLDIARTAHRSGLRSNATMLYGHIETYAERVEHMIRLRDLQDETGGFLTFIPLAMDPTNTELADIKRDSGIDDLRNIAVARLMLDNFPHIKAFWIMITPPVAQTSLWYGADDMDGTIMEYEITHVGVDAKDHRQGLSQKQMIRLIESAGREPVERDTLYNRLGDDGKLLAGAAAGVQ